MRLLIVLILAVAPALAQHNPVLPGDHPDPSIIRIAKDYWATATSSQWAPVYPILHSTDMLNWTVEGAVFAEPPKWSVSNYWAPEIAEHQGRVFVYYTARKKDGPLCVAVATAATPKGPYEDHGPMVCDEAGSIDAAPATDENGRRYLIWKEDGNSRRKPTPLWAQPLSEDGLRLVGERRELFHNDAQWEGQVVEGPFVLRRNGWFYMFYSGAGCCGLKCNYALGVARSKKLLGPWEKYSGNPILAANADWNCPGHGSIVEDPSGRTFLLYHAYDPSGSIWVGRQGLLDEVTWSANGWPAINSGKGPTAAAHRKPNGFSTDFDTLTTELQWPVSQKSAARVKDGWLELTALGGADSLRAVIAKPTAAVSYTAVTRLDIQKLKDAVSAGLAAYGNARNATGVSAGRGRLVLWLREKGVNKELASMPFSGPTVQLRMRSYESKRFDFAYRADDQDEWHQISKDVTAGDLPPWDLGTRVALTCGGADGATARFDYFRIENQ